MRRFELHLLKEKELATGTAEGRVSALCRLTELPATGARPAITRE
jgi:hypothetical protein